jgi:hypothetical protein
MSVKDRFDVLAALQRIADKAKAGANAKADAELTALLPDALLIFGTFLCDFNRIADALEKRAEPPRQ